MKPGFLWVLAGETLQSLIGGCARLAAVLFARTGTGSLPSACPTLAGKQGANPSHSWMLFAARGGLSSWGSAEASAPQDS